jgi:hypothetical protein
MSITSKTSTTVAANLARVYGKFSNWNNWIFSVYLRKKVSSGRGGDESSRSERSRAWRFCGLVRGFVCIHNNI